MQILLILLLYATWSWAFPIGKWLLEYSPPVFLTAARMIFAGVILLGFLWIKKSLPKSISKKQLIALSFLAIFSIYVTNILEFWGLHRLTASKTCFIYSLSPIIAAVLSYIHFKEKMTGMKLVGLGIGVLGFIPVLLEKSSMEELLHAFGYFSWPELAVAGAAFFSVYGWVLLRIIVKDEAISPFFANGFSMLLGGCLALFSSLYIDTWTPLPIAPNMALSVLCVILFLTFLSNILCYNLYGFLLKKYTATLMTFFGLLSPLFASLHSWILLGETPSPYVLTSTSVVVFGLWLFYRQELKQGYVTTN